MNVYFKKERQVNPSELIDQQIKGLTDWRGPLFAQLRRIIHEADPEIVEEWKWNTAAWSHKKPVCAVAAFQNGVKINFFQGAALEDPHGLFNAGLGAEKSRAIDFEEGHPVNEAALIDLVRAAVQLALKAKSKKAK